MPFFLNSRLMIRCCLAVATAYIAFSNCFPALAQEQLAIPTAPTDVRSFLETNCYDCHAGSSAEAGLDLENLSDQLDDDNSIKWVRVFDRVHDGEMPPADYDSPPADERQRFLDQTSKWIKHVQQTEFEAIGRVRGRRLTNLQLERTLHDLLGIDIPLASRMPDEPRTNGFNTVADGQAMSHFQLEQHVSVVDVALDEAFRRALGKPDEWKKKLSATQIARQRARSRTREPEMLDGQAVVWSGRLVFYGRIPATTAKEDGWYRFKIRSNGLKVPDDRGIWCTVRSGQCISSAPLMAWVGAYEVDEQPKEVVMEAWLWRDQKLEIRPGDLTLKRARFKGGQVGTGEGGPQDVPGLAIDSIEMERFHRGPDNQAIQHMLLGDLDVNTATNPQDASVQPGSPVELKRLMTRFARRAFRRPVEEVAIAPYVALAEKSIEQDGDFLTAIRLGYRAILCSPRFLYFQEQPGQLDDYAIATRLSYLIWNRMPDKTLLKLAKSNKLQDKAVLESQVDRMVADPRGANFVKDFADQWLDLNLIDFTEPDPKLYPGFDPIVQNSMLDETHAFLQKMLDDDLSISLLIDSKFTFLNSRLARYYNVDQVESDELQQVSLPENSPRGGLITQGSIMKVTANGTNTSPVLRGVWVSERLLGEPIPPPPENVPAIEPDIRGAKTIREMLAKHKENGDCAACHRKIDPPGFALENFDPSGRWRDNYLLAKRKLGLEVDASFSMPNGESFEDLHGFKQIMLKQKPQLARNYVEKLLVYGTGANVEFADRETVNACVEQTAKDDYGVKSLLKSVVTSSVFLKK